MALHKITEEKFNQIKKCLKTPILVKPSVAYVADSFGYSTGTVSRINRCGTFEEYKTRRDYDFIKSDIEYEKYEKEKAKESINNFNKEWYFNEELRNGLIQKKED